MTKRLLRISMVVLVALSAGGYELGANAAPRTARTAPTLQSLSARIAVLENEVKQLRRDEFQNQIDALRKSVFYLCSQPGVTCPA